MDVTQTRAARGPRPWELLGNLIDIGRDRLGFLREMTRRYGDIVRFHMGTRPVLLVSSAEGARHVLKTGEQNYRKGMGLKDAEPLLGSGLLTSEGELWREQHARIQPLFTSQAVASYVQIMVEETAAMLERWEPHARAGTPVDIAAEMTRLTLRILGRALFGGGLEPAIEAIGRAMTLAMEHAMARMVFPPAAWLPTPGLFRFRRALRELDAHVQEMMERHDASAGPPSVLTALLGNEPASLTSEQRRQVRDEILTLIVAGHETTAALLSWTWMLLALNPDARRRMEAESAEVLGEGLPTLKSLSQLSYGRRTLEEAMRLYPPVWILPREAIVADEICGVTVPAGAGVLVSPYTLHRHPACWEEPEAFNPDRFAPAQATGRSPYAYLPFGAGPRQCIGRYFSLTEAQCVLAMVSVRFRVELVPGHAVVAEPLLTLRPRGGIPVILHRK